MFPSRKVHGWSTEFQNCKKNSSKIEPKLVPCPRRRWAQAKVRAESTGESDHQKGYKVAGWGTEQGILVETSNNLRVIERLPPRTVLDQRMECSFSTAEVLQDPYVRSAPSLCKLILSSHPIPLKTMATCKVWSMKVNLLLSFAYTKYLWAIRKTHSLPPLVP